MDFIHLSDLIPFLQNAYIKIDNKFMKQLLIDSSGSNEPHKNKNFAEAVGYLYNPKYNSAPGIAQVFYGERNIRINSLEKILQQSKYSWADVEKQLIYIKAGIHKGEINPSFPIGIGNEVGSVLGYILGDGAISVRDNAVFFSNSDIALLKDFSNSMDKIFNIKPRIWAQEKRKFEEKSKWLKRVASLEEVPKDHCVGLFYPKICGLILNGLFGNFAVGKDKTITKEILTSNLSLKKGLVA